LVTGDLKLFGICHLVIGNYQMSVVDEDATWDSMKMKLEPIIVLATCGSEEEALRIANALVEEHLAACVNLVSPIRSIYRWEGKIWDEKEWLLIIKTQKKRFQELEKKVKSLHSYSVPEIISLSIVEESSSYLNWLVEMTEEQKS
jgi:periplasmic divalent cation tolerance protein